jgi:DNA helicase HerA-like ATPase
MIGRIAKLKRLLDIGDNDIALSGILTNRFIDDVEIKDGGINDMEFSLKPNKKGVKSINKFEVKVKRKNIDDSINPPNPFLPPIPFALYVLGVVKAGKTTLMRSILDIYIDAFDEVVFISPTFQLDPEAIDLLDEYPEIKPFKSITILQKLVTRLEKTNRGKPPREKLKTLIIMDDVVNEIIKISKKENSAINRISTNRRHLGVSIILMSQFFRRIPPLMRSNFSAFAIFRLENQKEKKKVIEELSGFLGEKEFERIFDIATQEPFNFLSINFDGESKELVYTKNFNEIIITGQEKFSINE